jgi:peptide chain release factor
VVCLSAAVTDRRYKITAPCVIPGLQSMANHLRWGMSSFTVSSDKLAQLEQRMTALGVRASEIEESFVRSGGAGGQKVNKSSSCVMLLHRPTGLRVKCQMTRHQALNRFLARRLLLDKIERMQKGYVETERSQIEKIRRQKRKRSRRAKERLLADKARHGEKKRLRVAVTTD